MNNLKQLEQLDDVDFSQSEVNISDAELQTVDDLDEARNAVEVLEAVGRLSHRPKTPESQVILSAAGQMLADELKEGDDS
jgi:hypothetical protein